MAEALALANQAEIVSRIKDFGINNPSADQIALIEGFASGKNIVVTADTSAASRTTAIQTYTAFLALLGERRERALIVVDTDDAVDQVCRELGDLRVPYSKITASRSRPPKNSLTTSRAIVASAASLLSAFDEGLIDGSGINRIVLDGCEREIISGKVEEILNLLHDLSQTQVVLIRKDPLLNISNFMNKYLSGAQELQIQGAAPASASEAVAVSEQPVAALEDMVHGYVELPAELLAKPNILADLIEAEGCPPTAVFCNSPSDADLTDVMLRKRGITTRKLVGYVSPQRVEAAMEAIKSGEATAIVLTDIAGKNANLTDIELVINHSIHNDPEVYVARARVSHGGNPTKKVLSLATPIDLTAFHFLKKTVTVQFDKIEPPSREQILAARLENLARRAQQKNLSAEERITTLTNLILNDPRKEAIIGLLVYNTYDVMPSLSASSSRERGGDREEGGSRDGGEWRDDRRGNRRDRRRGGRGGRDSYDEGSGNERRDTWRGEGEGSDENEQSTREPRPERAPYVPPAKETRLYIGHGSKDGVTAETLVSMITEKGGIDREQVKRSILRPLYSFVDVPEELAPTLLEKLEQSTFKGEEKLFVRRATQISTPRPEAKEEAAEAGSIDEGAPVAESSEGSALSAESELAS